jgi:hypothetical protein
MTFTSTHDGKFDCLFLFRDCWYELTTLQINKITILKTKEVPKYFFNHSCVRVSKKHVCKERVSVGEKEEPLKAVLKRLSFIHKVFGI